MLTTAVVFRLHFDTEEVKPDLFLILKKKRRNAILHNYKGYLYTFMYLMSRIVKKIGSDYEFLTYMAPSVYDQKTKMTCNMVQKA